MLVILFESVILLKLLHASNASFPMLVTLSGIVTLVKFLQLSNAEFPILVTPSSITTFLTSELLYTGLGLSSLL